MTGAQHRTYIHAAHLSKLPVIAAFPFCQLWPEIVTNSGCCALRVSVAVNNGDHGRWGLLRSTVQHGAMAGVSFSWLVWSGKRQPLSNWQLSPPDGFCPISYLWSHLHHIYFIARYQTPTHHERGLEINCSHCFCCNPQGRACLLLGDSCSSGSSALVMSGIGLTGLLPRWSLKSCSTARDETLLCVYIHQASFTSKEILVTQLSPAPTWQTS